MGQRLYQLLKAQKIIDGYPDGTFKPSKEVSYQEFIKMIVVALGHGIKSTDDPISYPNGYLAIATTEKVTTGVNATSTQPASRSIVAKLAYNAIMDATYLRVAKDEDDDTKATIARDVLGIKSVEGTLTALTTTASHWQ